jgi:hypothetical protein
MAEPVAPITVTSSGIIVDYGGSGGAIRSALPAPTRLSVTTTGTGTLALNRRVSGRQGAIDAWVSPGSQTGIANVANLVLGSGHITLALSSANRISAYLTNQAGVTVGTLAPGSGAATQLTAGKITKISLKWDAAAGTIVAYINDAAVAQSTWTTHPNGTAWVPFQPDTLTTGRASGSYVLLVGDLFRVTVRDSLV